MLENFYFKKFNKSERSTFTYWYYHWKAFNLLAFSLGCWKFKYLFHDFEKPWLRLFLPYEKVQEIHRKNNAHHLEYKKSPNYDWEAMVLDWECSRFTKNAAQLNARDECNRKINNNHEHSDLLKANFFNTCDKLGLIK
jgi:hypothetical protein